MGKQHRSERATTPPKGRPTRTRRQYAEPKVFGPVAQWIAVVVLLALVFAVLVILTDGGDFNPFDGASPHGPVVEPA